MSTPSQNDLASALQDLPLRGFPSRKRLSATFRRMAFWAAVALPFLHVPLLATGLDSPSVTLAFVGLLALNLLALLVGHRHERN